MLDDIREWISDNLRYLLLGFAVVLLLLVILFVVRLVGGPKDKKEPETQAATEQVSEGESEVDDGIALTENDPEILELMTRYYNAKTEKNLDTIRAINPSFSAEDEANLQEDDVIEGYSNIMVYSHEGLTKDSYIVYVYFDVKISGIATEAPTMVDEYLEKDESGNLIITNKNSTQELVNFVEMMRASSAVQRIRSDVDRKLSQAMKEDSDLAGYVESINKKGNSAGTASGEGEGDAGTVAPDENGSAKATTEVRVRSEASTNGEIYGMLTNGMSVTVLENQDNGWSKIRYTVNGVTIEGYVMTMYLTAQ